MAATTELAYRIEKRPGGFAVYSRTTPVARKITGAANRLSIETVPARQLFPGYDESVFYTYYNGQGVWATDINCGCQRWSGDKTTRQIQAALRKCGFDRDVIRETITEAKGKRA